MTISMKKIILACLLATSAASAFAEWTKVEEVADIKFYIDYKTLRKDGGLRKIWLIMDEAQREKDGSISSRQQLEFDCKAESRRILALSTHTGQMAGGETTFSGGSDPRGWRAIPPNTPMETILKIVCAK